MNRRELLIGMVTAPVVAMIPVPPTIETAPLAEAASEWAFANIPIPPHAVIRTFKAGGAIQLGDAVGLRMTDGCMVSLNKTVEAFGTVIGVNPAESLVRVLGSSGPSRVYY